MTAPDDAVHTGAPVGKTRLGGLNWRRYDTLGLRLFVLMWLTLVLSHLLAFSIASPLARPDGPGGSGGSSRPTLADRMDPQRLPTLPSLPPGGPFTGPGPQSGPGGPGGPNGASPNGAGPNRPGPNRPGPGPDGMTDSPPEPRGPRGLPTAVLWLDYGVRMAVIALGAALGARWLARPMQRLATASRALSQGLARGQPPPVLDEQFGTREVRDTAHVFNSMAARLQEQFDARGMHLASVSHDLRTPLTRLRMRLEDAPPDLADAAAGDIREMGDMIDTTLEVLQEQREGGQVHVVDMRAMLEAIVDDLANAGHHVSLVAPDAPLHALARPAALKRIVGNLAGNALRYGGSARITLLAQPAAGPAPARDAAHALAGVAVTVDDDGPGIPPDQLELAFRPWVRLTTAHARSGHGLGLAIARDLAERDHGSVTLANRQPHGLQARLWLPLASVGQPG